MGKMRINVIQFVTITTPLTHLTAFQIAILTTAHVQSTTFNVHQAAVCLQQLSATNTRTVLMGQTRSMMCVHMI